MSAEKAYFNSLPAGGIPSMLTASGPSPFLAEPSTKPILAGAPPPVVCAHGRGLWIVSEDVRCRDCNEVLGSVWDEEYAQEAFDGFNEAYYALE